MYNVVPYLPWIVLGVAVLAILASGYVKAPPDMAYIISGLHKKPRILIGKAGVKIPFLERLDKLSLGAIQIDVKTGSAVPTAEYINVKVDSTVSVRVGREPESIALAAQNFLNVSREQIARKINDLLEGNIREIVGQMRLTEMVGDRKLFSEKVQANAVPDLRAFGLELITFNVQNFIDDNDVITNLGIDNVEQIRKGAAIAKSNAQREIAIAEAANAKQANDAKVQAQEEIAERNNDLAIRQARLQKEADQERAQAEAAKGIEAENQRKLKEVAETDANIARAQREAELKQKQIELKEYELDALVRKQADADKYQAEKIAEAELVARQRKADAERYEQEQAAQARMKAAEAAKFAKEQEAAGIRAVGEAEAEAIRAKALAEAEGIDKKAEAMKKYGEAAIIEMIVGALPEIAKNVAEPLSKVDKITMYGEGNSAKLIGDIVNGTTQITEGMTQGLGLDLRALLAGALGGKLAAAPEKKEEPAPAAQVPAPTQLPLEDEEI
ncbi:MAG: flotillin family protein [Oscillospiraceae bacterium]|nr:flotillin family protein [Oscillospiraceae bacterium]